MRRFNINSFTVSCVNMNSALTYIAKCIEDKKYGYICVSNSRVAYQSAHDQLYCKIQNNSLLTTPDGMPLVWIAHNLGYQEVGRVCGPDLFKNILDRSVEKGYTHYFYGSTSSTIAAIQDRMANDYPNIKVLGFVSPPFQPIEKFDIDTIAAEINALKPTFFWCGLGAPKQEQFMALLQPKLESTICIGVGLVFEYFAGTVKRAPKLMRRLGLEWFVRCIQQPKRFFQRMLKPFFWILWKIFISLFDVKQSN